MTNATKRCRVCDEPVSAKRQDKEFCSDRCAAQWARDEGYRRERFHAEKPEHNFAFCEQCGNKYEFNDYAARGGKRQAKFCSNKCRQAAYRERKAAEGKSAGYTGHWDDARNNKRSKGTSQKTGSGNQKSEARNDRRSKGTSQESGKGTSQESASNKGTSQTAEKRWKSKDPYEILGVLRTSTRETIKREWRKLLRTYHPDVYKEPDAGFISKQINWAWDKIENPGSRTNRR